jgi:hypothetical protein
MTDSSEPVRVVVAVDPDRYADVVERLRTAGLHVDEQWPITGTLSGHLAREALAAARAVDGVLGVEEPRTFRIAPPGSPVQ